MAFNFFSIVLDIKPRTFWGVKKSHPSVEDAIKKVGFSILKEINSKDDFYNFNEFGSITALEFSGRYLLIGDCLLELFDEKKQSLLLQDDMVCHLISILDTSETYYFKYFYKGQEGVSAFADSMRNQVQMVNYADGDFLVRSPFYDEVLEHITLGCKIDIDLLKRVCTGFSGKGRNGLGYHADKKEWVLCKELDECFPNGNTQYQELNRNSYKKKGKPFEVSLCPTMNWSYLSQAQLYYEIIHMTIPANSGL